MPRHRLRDASWASLHARLVTIPSIWKKDPERLRRFVEAVVHVLCTGVAWQDLPTPFGEAQTIYRRFRRWAGKGLWDELFIDGIPTDVLETVMLDFTACKAQRFASRARGGDEEALGRSRDGLTTRSMLWSMVSVVPCASCSHPGRPPTADRPAPCWKK